MIEPQPAQRGQIGDQHGLYRLPQTLVDLRQGQHQQGVRDVQIAEQLATLTKYSQRSSWVLARCAGLLLLFGGAIAWHAQHQPEVGYVRAYAALDTTLVQQWPSLPKATQEALSATYARLGLTPPGARK